MLRRGLDQLLALVAPPSCLVCRAPPARAGDILCPACRRAMPWLGVAGGDRGLCGRCALPAPCGAPCPAARAAWDRAWSAVAYDGPARELVLALKFRGALAAAGQMAAAVAAAAPADLLGPGAVLVPVPLPRARERARGFDQARRIADALSARIGVPVDACLRRRGEASRQLGAPREARLAAGRLAVEMTPRRRAAVAHASVAVVIDDVHTTGATFEACARVLRAGGWRRIHVVSYARTL
jgi:predicted amidophosphoribosyltransferase